MPLKELYLKKNEERRLVAGHLWIYSNEIDTHKAPLKSYEPGELVSVISAKGKVMGVAYVNPHALICARLLSTKLELIDEAFFVKAFQRAFSLRQLFYLQPYYRLVYAESDFLPGLIVDRYNDVFVLQTNTFGMEKLTDLICKALINIFNPSAIILKNNSSMRQLEGLPSDVSIAYGNAPEVTTIEENDCRYTIPLLEGQKTGWFYDHRENRKRLARYVTGKTVLDAFSYRGGWGIQAAHYGAKEVLCIDNSAQALAGVQENALLNGYNQVHCLQSDVFDALKQLVQNRRQFDVIILDPPALIKKRKDNDEGVIAYLRLNELAMQLLSKVGVLVSCSCSQHLSSDQLTDIIRRASLKTGKKTQIVERGFQGLDHPIHPAIAETAYLKALFCIVQDKD